MPLKMLRTTKKTGQIKYNEKQHKKKQFIHNVFLICVIKHKLCWFRACFLRALKSNIDSVLWFDDIFKFITHFNCNFQLEREGIACYASLSILCATLERERIIQFKNVYVFFFFYFLLLSHIFNVVSNWQSDDWKVKLDQHEKHRQTEKYQIIISICNKIM